MGEEIKFNRVQDIVLQYRNLKPNQGFEIYYETCDYENTGDIVIISQIIPAGYDVDYSIDIPIQPKNALRKFTTGVQIISWDIGDKRFEINIEHISKIEIIENPIEEIMKQVERL